VHDQGEAGRVEELEPVEVDHDPFAGIDRDAERRLQGRHVGQIELALEREMDVGASIRTADRQEPVLHLDIGGAHWGPPFELAGKSRSASRCAPTVSPSS